MGKFQLGGKVRVTTGSIQKDYLYVNESKVKKYQKEIDKQLDVISNSLLKSYSYLMEAVKDEKVKGKRKEAFKGWARKAKSQAAATKKLRDTLQDSYLEDAQEYPIRKLDSRIAELEKKIAKMEKK